MPEITIDGLRVAAAEGTTVLQAAREAGIAIPSLCYDPRVTPGGSCRICLVEIEADGGGRTVPACTYTVKEAMVVRTGSEGLQRFRRNLLDLVLSEQPDGPCPRCAEIGLCEVHALARELGAEGERFAGAHSGAAVHDGNPFIGRDYSRCIFCYRCTRVCNEVEQANAIVPGGRGFTSRITTLMERGLMQTSCTFCGQCINTCPTGALSDLPRRERAGGKPVQRSVQTVCPFCGTGCTLLLDVVEGRIAGARGDPTSPVSRGSLCVKGQFGWDFVHSPERLTRPLVRRDGDLRPATWDEAYDIIARRFSAIRDAYGPDAMVFWSSARATSEANYLFQKFARAVIGTNNVDNCART